MREPVQAVGAVVAQLVLALAVWVLHRMFLPVIARHSRRTRALRNTPATLTISSGFIFLFGARLAPTDRPISLGKYPLLSVPERARPPGLQGSHEASIFDLPMSVTSACPS